MPSPVRLRADGPAGDTQGMPEEPAVAQRLAQGLDGRLGCVYICRYMFRIRFARGALDDMKRLRARDRVRVVEEIQRRLTDRPQEPDRNRKELAGLVPPWEHVKSVWEVRIGEHRVFYDVDSEAQQVIVRAIRRKGRSATKEIL